MAFPASSKAGPRPFVAVAAAYRRRGSRPPSSPQSLSPTAPSSSMRYSCFFPSSPPRF
jgi:hypothetical protein